MRYCTTPRCRQLVEKGKCADCRRTADRARGTAHQRGYTGEWALYSKRWLQLHRWCGERQDFRLYEAHSRCVQEGLRTRADVTDHITPLAQGGARFDGANHQSLCGACNRRKAIALEGAFSVIH